MPRPPPERDGSDLPRLRFRRRGDLARKFAGTAWIDEAEEELPELRAFVLPGGSAGAAALHVARTVCRRAERAVVRLAEGDQVSAEVVIFLNRLSDLLFSLARLENHRAGRGDVEWSKRDGAE